MNWDIYIRDIYSRHICVYIDIRIYISKHVPYKYIYIYVTCIFEPNLSRNNVGLETSSQVAVLCYRQPFV